MKRESLSTLLLLAGLFAVILMNSQSAESFPDKPDSAKADRLLRHIVLFKFKEGTTEEQIDEIVKGFGELPAKIDAIHDYEWGTNNSPEDHAHGYTHCFLVTFKTEADRDAYLPHPAHQAFVKVLLPHLDEVHVVDYWTNS
jgi:hypothetical protein